MDDNGQQGVEQAEDLAEGYPSLSDVLSAIAAESDLPEDGVRRCEINIFASGDATYRYWTVYELEHQGGYLQIT